MPTSDFKCPCGKDGKFYKDCCKRIHDDIYLAKTAEQLMRSRYSAFALCLGDYLVNSHASIYRESLNISNTMRWARSVAWNHLEIMYSTEGLENDSVGTVEFKAYFREKNKMKCIHENSKFIKEDNHWVYLHEI